MDMTLDIINGVALWWELQNQVLPLYKCLNATKVLIYDAWYFRYLRTFFSIMRGKSFKVSDNDDVA